MVVRNSNALDGPVEVLVVIIVLAAIATIAFNNVQFVWAITGNPTATIGILLITAITVVIGYQTPTARNVITKATMILMLVFLIALEIFNGMGFSQNRMAAMKKEAIEKSPQYLEMMKKLGEANASVQTLSAGNTPEAAAAGATAKGLQDSIASLRQSMNALPANRKTQRSLMASEIAGKQAEMADVLGLAASFDAYQAAVEKRDAISAEMAKMATANSESATSGAAQLDAVFVNVAERLGTAPAVVQTYWNTATNVVLTLIAIFGLSLLSDKPSPPPGRIINQTANDYQVDIVDDKKYKEMQQQLAFLTGELEKLSNPAPAIVNASGDHTDAPKA